MQQHIPAKITVAEAAARRGDAVTLQGHIYAVRRMGGVTFVVLRDRTGTIQMVYSGSEKDLPLEAPVVASGVLVETQRQKLGVELHTSSIEILSSPAASLPVEISRPKRMESLSLQALLDYRPLTLRAQTVRAIFKIEAEICKAFREFLCETGFTEIHSPKIVATGTEGGANLFALEYFGRTAYLAQSPQFYKQMMVGVFERVFEIGPVYRAEEHNTARHLNEYISMDFEMGFIQSERDLLEMETRLLSHVFSSLKQRCEEELALFGASVPEFEEIPRLTLAEARKILKEKYGWKSESEDLDPEGERLLTAHFEKTEGIELVFVTHYPWEIRPFYAMPEEGTLSRSFDLLYRGLEITTGGQRIHQYEMLLESMRTRKLEPESFEDYLQCFKYGMPPHGGLAIGLERLTKQLLGLSNVREASLFPRDGNRVSP